MEASAQVSNTAQRFHRKQSARDESSPLVKSGNCVVRKGIPSKRGSCNSCYDLLAAACVEPRGNVDIRLLL